VRSERPARRAYGIPRGAAEEELLPLAAQQAIVAIRPRANLVNG
jgi:hypothetical protein